MELLAGQTERASRDGGKCMIDTACSSYEKKDELL
jgi:hypothetical protein